MSSARSLSEKAYSAFLFDMDGTLLSSIAVAERVWGSWATRHGFDAAVFLKTVHGQRAEDVIRGLALEGVDPVAEAAALLAEEMDDMSGIEALPGVLDFLAILPRDRWAIVTSAPLELAKRRLEAAKIDLPDLVISAENVTVGKPSPQCYLLAAEKLGIAASECLVFEDAMAGIVAGEAAGADILVITATHATPFETTHLSVSDYSGLTVSVEENGQLRIITH